MTKQKALAMMLEYSRSIVAPSFASKLAKAFGYTLKQLGFKGTEKYRLTNAKIDIPECAGVSIEELAQKLVETLDFYADVFKEVRFEYGHTEDEEKDGSFSHRFLVTSPYHGRGTGAEHIVTECVKLLRLEYGRICSKCLKEKCDCLGGHRIYPKA